MYTPEDSLDYEGMMAGSRDYNAIFYEMMAFLKERWATNSIQKRRGAVTCASIVFSLMCPAFSGTKHARSSKPVASIYT